MSKFYNVRNGGDPTVGYGFQYANSANVSPSNVVAVASPGTALTLDQLNKYDFFNAAQTSAATDLIILPTAAPVGTRVIFFCVSACKVKAAASSGIGTNGGTDAQGITLVANAITEFLRISATNWIATQYAAAGTVTAPTPA